jgi:hypothetical protein
MADDVLLNKAAAIERAVRRVREEYAGDDSNLLSNETRQDAIILNLQRACEASIDPPCISFECTASACRRKPARRSTSSNARAWSIPTCRTG